MQSKERKKMKTGTEAMNKTITLMISEAATEGGKPPPATLL